MDSMQLLFLIFYALFFLFLGGFIEFLSARRGLDKISECFINIHKADLLFLDDLMKKHPELRPEITNHLHEVIQRLRSEIRTKDPSSTL